MAGAAAAGDSGTRDPDPYDGAPRRSAETRATGPDDSLLLVGAGVSGPAIGGLLVAARHWIRPWRRCAAARSSG
ncbi:hypothetical protein BJF78_27700 [Pseudonocardia sp. CNS-139]|nr:hypothetical protein BJF78_27700 [Pseudonocardia sp. CNS-139]